MARAWKGVNTLVPGLVITVSLMIVTALLIARMLDSIALAIEHGVEHRRTPHYTMRITWVSYTEAYGGPSLKLELANEGPEAIYDVGALEVIVSYESLRARIVEILRFKSGTVDWTPGYWSVVEVKVGDRRFSYESHPYLRPGETALITVHLSREPDVGALISIAIISPEAVKAEFSLTR